MIVILGSRNKSKKLEHLMYTQFMNYNILVLDGIGDNYFSAHDQFDHITVNTNYTYKQVINYFKINYTEMFSRYDWIAFHIKADESSIAIFKQLEREYPQNFILTVYRANGLTNVYNY
ncbi:hypothetical protein MKY15_21735 [Sporosarcina sp. FSL K6-1540]|uniref:hypothetical protein n=1 Tax=Sporosarcina sp. FSL K6-1540 TaxID=2921555 RepID=UPI00315A1A19